MYEAATNCKDITWAPLTNWEPRCVTLAGYCYAVRHGMKVELVTPYRVSYGVTVRGNVTSVYPPLGTVGAPVVGTLSQLTSHKTISTLSPLLWHTLNSWYTYFENGQSFSFRCRLPTQHLPTVLSPTVISNRYFQSLQPTTDDTRHL
jgi:hypothetical protein